MVLFYLVFHFGFAHAFYDTGCVVREKLAIIIVEDFQLFQNILNIL